MASTTTTAASLTEWLALVSHSLLRGDAAATAALLAREAQAEADPLADDASGRGGGYLGLLLAVAARAHPGVAEILTQLQQQPAAAAAAAINPPPTPAAVALFAAVRFRHAVTSRWALPLTPARERRGEGAARHRIQCLVLECLTASPGGGTGGGSPSAAAASSSPPDTTTTTTTLLRRAEMQQLASGIAAMARHAWPVGRWPALFPTLGRMLASQTHAAEYVTFAGAAANKQPAAASGSGISSDDEELDGGSFGSSPLSSPPLSANTTAAGRVGANVPVLDRALLTLAELCDGVLKRLAAPQSYRRAPVDLHAELQPVLVPAMALWRAILGNFVALLDELLRKDAGSTDSRADRLARPVALQLRRFADRVLRVLQGVRGILVRSLPQEIDTGSGGGPTTQQQQQQGARDACEALSFVASIPEVLPRLLLFRSCLMKMAALDGRTRLYLHSVLTELCLEMVATVNDLQDARPMLLLKCVPGLLSLYARAILAPNVAFDRSSGEGGGAQGGGDGDDDGDDALGGGAFTFEQLCAVALGFLKQVLRCPDYGRVSDGTTPLRAVLSDDAVRSLVPVLFAYFALTPSDRVLWESDPEAVLAREQGQDMEVHARSAALHVCWLLAQRYESVVVPLILQELDSALGASASAGAGGELRHRRRVESAYAAMAQCADPVLSWLFAQKRSGNGAPLQSIVQWYTERLPRDVAHSASSVLRWRAVSLLATWRACCEEQDRSEGRFYELAGGALCDADRVVCLSAVTALQTVLEEDLCAAAEADEEEEERQAAGVGDQGGTQAALVLVHSAPALFALLPRLEAHSSRDAVLDLLRFLIQSATPALLMMPLNSAAAVAASSAGTASTTVAYLCTQLSQLLAARLPDEDRAPLQASVVTCFSCIVHVLGPQSEEIHGSLLRLIHELTPATPQQAAQAERESGGLVQERVLGLWNDILAAVPRFGVSPQMAALFSERWMVAFAAACSRREPDVLLDLLSVLRSYIVLGWPSLPPGAPHCSDAQQGFVGAHAQALLSRLLPQALESLDFVALGGSLGSFASARMVDKREDAIDEAVECLCLLLQLDSAVPGGVLSGCDLNALGQLTSLLLQASLSQHRLRRGGAQQQQQQAVTDAAALAAELEAEADAEALGEAPLHVAYLVLLARILGVQGGDALLAGAAAAAAASSSGHAGATQQQQQQQQRDTFAELCSAWMHCYRSVGQVDRAVLLTALYRAIVGFSLRDLAPVYLPLLLQQDALLLQDEAGVAEEGLYCDARGASLREDAPLPMAWLLEERTQWVATLLWQQVRTNGSAVLNAGVAEGVRAMGVAVHQQ